ncbi:ATP-binding protein [Tunturibacter psychrotolerans]|uniref:ATP-binding protein n=1 Tax=Tunturiibacter psychrotolerans TaxID=3069686 RepID=A0AAU7ZUC0_9BACT
MNLSVEQSMSGPAVETASARDVVSSIKQLFQSLFCLLDHNHLSREERQSEQAHIVRKFHDTLNQSFPGASMLLDESLETNSVDPFDRHSLEPTTIEQSLSGVLRDLSPAGVRCEISVTGKPKSLRPAILKQITSIGREALVNALQHSEATLIEAEVEYSSRRLRLIVRDNGRGIDPHIARSGKGSHWGLLGMREQAARIGAQLSIWSRSGAGTEVEVSVPNHIVANACA